MRTGLEVPCEAFPLKNRFTYIGRYSIFFLYLKIYLNTVAIQQKELIFNGPCNYNKNIQFRKNVKPTTDQLHAMLDTYYNLNYNNYITKYQYALIYLDILM